VAGRALAFSDKDVVRMATEDFVSVAADDWYQRRRDDAEGAFFRKVADQGDRKGVDGSTRQGIYVLTASGKLLAYKNHQDPEVMKDVLRRALAEWKKLPADERAPGSVKVGDAGKVDPRYARTPPEGGLILNVSTRILDQDGKGRLCKGSCEFPGGDRAARDHCWLTKAEWESLVPAEPKKGDSAPLPAAVALRLARHHLVDNTRGEASSWRPEQVRRQKLTLTVDDVSDKALRLKIEGEVLLATAADADRADRGFEARVLGFVEYDRDRKALTRFDVTAVGEHWGDTPLTRGARPGRKPLGVAFELSRGVGGDRVPPQGARDRGDYFGRGR
jgi:hypothetical protein